VAELPALLERATASAVHLETHDSYESIDPDWDDWREGRRFDPAERWSAWFSLVQRTTARGVQIRRIRIVTRPLTPYIAYEHEITAAHNIAAGEQVRWLDRHAHLDRLAPLNDFWVLDNAVVVLNLFDSQGQMFEEVSDNAGLAVLYRCIFDELWDAATPHAEFKP
jgi:hypothetical protein